MLWSGMPHHPTGKWYLARETHEPGFTEALKRSTNERQGLLVAIIMFSLDYDVMARARTETPGQAQGADESEVGKVKLVGGVSVGNLVEFALVTTTTRNRAAGAGVAVGARELSFHCLERACRWSPGDRYVIETRDSRNASKQGTIGCLA
jgi:hypothetical protein